MKKFLPILMVIAMVFAMGLNAFAAELTINNSDGRTYNGYKLLNLTTSLKADDACTGDHTDDCYNYAYTINAKYADVLKAEVFANASDDFWVDSGKPASAADVNADQILEYLSSVGNDGLRDVADRIYRDIQAKSIAADATDLTGAANTIEQGYWLFADVSELDGNEANSLVMVDTAGQEDIVINPKTALPTIEKKVKDIADSEDSNIVDNLWQDSADHDIGDTVPFKLTATLPANVANYETYEIIFHDTLSAGLTLNQNTIKVYMYDTKADADADVEMTDFAKDVTANFTVATNNHCSFEVSCDDVLAIEGVDKDTAFVVYYSATLNEDAVIGAVGNPNEVYLEFSNNPYGDGTGNTETDKVIVFTYEVLINKVDAQGEALKGAGFTLYKKGADGNYVAIGAEVKGEDMTTFTWIGLDDGEYKLSETTVPGGYNKMLDIEFVISAEHSETADEPALISLNSTLGTADKTTGIITEDIVNQTGTVLPETGSTGTFLLIGGGAILVILAAVFMITRKKMSVYAD